MQSNVRYLDGGQVAQHDGREIHTYKSNRQGLRHRKICKRNFFLYRLMLAGEYAIRKSMRAPPPAEKYKLPPFTWRTPQLKLSTLPETTLSQTGNSVPLSGPPGTCPSFYGRSQNSSRLARASHLRRHRLPCCTPHPRAKKNVCRLILRVTRRHTGAIAGPTHSSNIRSLAYGCLERYFTVVPHLKSGLLGLATLK